MQSIPAAGAEPILQQRATNIPVLIIYQRRFPERDISTKLITAGLLALLPGTSGLNESYVHRAIARASGRELQHSSITRTRAHVCAMYNSKN